MPVDPIDLLAPPRLPRAEGRDPDAEARALREFDSYFAAELLKSAARAPEAERRDDPLSGGEGGRLYRELFYQEIGRVVGMQGNLGMARAAGLASGAAGDEKERVR